VRLTLSSTDLIKIFDTMADTMEREKDYLSDLDGAIGDGDHGVNMAKCFREVKKRLPESKDKDVGTILKNVGMVILNSVGGAMGALYGTFFLKASKEAAGKTEVNFEDLIRMFEAGEKGLQEIGKAQPGDKTLLDTIDPAIKALKEAQAQGKPLGDALADLSEGAKRGAESTKGMISKIGRSSRLGERTLGHQDAGATSCYFILCAFYKGIQ
jgi:phosphoenolpyruvate---glycerone phosphotransferase subunit DhaL